MSDRRQLWVLAGGNGAGKSTYYRLYLEPLGLPFINADILAAKIAPKSAEQAAYEAARLAAQLRDSLLEAGESFCFETVFSHPSKVDFVGRAKGLGYEVTLVYIHLESPELNIARVAQRVTEGGHSVPAYKVMTRIPRTMQHIRTVLPLADHVRFYDNSSYTDPYRAVADLKGGMLSPLASPLPAWASEILGDYL